MPKTVVEKFNYSELKIEKLKFLTQIWAKLFCSSVFNVEGCLARRLTFRPFLTLATCLLIKNAYIKIIYLSLLTSFPNHVAEKLIKIQKKNDGTS